GGRHRDHPHGPAELRPDADLPVRAGRAAGRVHGGVRARPGRDRPGLALARAGPDGRRPGPPGEDPAAGGAGDGPVSPATWALVAIVGSGVMTVVTALAVESLTWRRRQRRETAAKLAAQQHPATPELDPIDEQIGIAAALLNPDGIEADVAAVIRQAETIARHAAGDTSDIPTIPGTDSRKDS